MNSLTQEEEERLKLHTRRGTLLYGLQLAVGGVLCAQIYKLQALESNRYQILADENRIKQNILAPERGIIRDRNGEPLALNQPNFILHIVRERSNDPEQTLRRLAKLIALPAGRIESLMKKLGMRNAFVPVMVADHLTWPEFASVNINMPSLQGLVPEVGWSRYYPQGDLTAHLLGYVGAVSKKDLQADSKNALLLRSPGFRIGKRGFERIQDKNLRGKEGVSRVEINAHGRIIREIDRESPIAGNNFDLTIDLRLQRFARKRTQGQSASVVVMDVNNGDILCLYSNPSFDPNIFVDGISQNQWNALLHDQFKPLLDKSVAGLYPPGSTFKMMVALAALEAGVKPDTKVKCDGHIDVGKRRFHCWKRGGHGLVDMVEAIEQSCDVFFYDIAKELGLEKITSMADRFGLGERPEIELPSIGAGLLPSREWKKKHRKASWFVGDTLNTAIGQGFTLVSPLQLVIMTARIANGGLKLNPRIVRAVNESPASYKELPSLGISKESMQIVQKGMDRVCNTETGTSYASRIRDLAIRMGGKTGTAQVRRITREQREEGLPEIESIPWEFRDHALFVAYAPVDKPRYSVAVVVEHGGAGSRAAAPIARDMLLVAQGRPYAEEVPS